jgi:hypothetical protein
MILCAQEYAKQIDKSIFPGTQGGPLMHVITGKAVAFGEALRPEFKTYQQQILKNAQALAAALKSHGYRLVSAGTDTHLMLVDLRDVHPDLTGKRAENWLAQANVIVNKNMIPFDERKPTQTSGLRLGTPALTTRGLQEGEMATVARLVHEAMSSEGDEARLAKVRGQVLELCQQFPVPHWSSWPAWGCLPPAAMGRPGSNWRRVTTSRSTRPRRAPCALVRAAATGGRMSRAGSGSPCSMSAARGWGAWGISSSSFHCCWRSPRPAKRATTK